MENKKLINKIYVTNIFILIIAVASLFFISFYEQENLNICIKNSFVIGICLLIFDYIFRQAIITNEILEENQRHLYRFYIGFILGILVSFICKFIPFASWPLVPIFLYLSFFSNPLCGNFCGIILVVLACTISQASIDIAAIYILTGIFAVILFSKFDKEIKIGGRLFLTLFCLLICILSNIYLNNSLNFSLELYIYPFVNVVITCILILGTFKYYASTILYKNTNDYLDINDVEYKYLAELKTNDLKEYMHSIHVEYFCERIANKLNLDINVLKCAGYYHKIVSNNSEYIKEIPFPEKARAVLIEYIKKDFKSKESSVLYCCDAIIYSINYMLLQNADTKPNYDKIIDSIFLHIDQKGLFKNSNITYSEMNIMKNIFKNERLYYDFLR